MKTLFLLSQHFADDFMYGMLALEKLLYLFMWGGYLTCVDNPTQATCCHVQTGKKQNLVGSGEILSGIGDPYQNLWGLLPTELI